jgi:hypothetical protein
MGSSRVDEQMAIVAAMLKAIADDVRQLRRAVEQIASEPKGKPDA